LSRSKGISISLKKRLWPSINLMRTGVGNE
jgi:hypothetical protein